MVITDISQLDLTKQYTYDDYLAWKIEERLELIKGWVMRMAASGRAHQYTCALNIDLSKVFLNNPS